jgi:hypothetical protein
MNEVPKYRQERLSPEVPVIQPIAPEKAAMPFGVFKTPRIFLRSHKPARTAARKT